MHHSKQPIGFWSAVSLGIDVMVGAGIFALLGEASSISGSAIYTSFILGGIIEYLSQAYGTSYFRWALSLYLLSLIYVAQKMLHSGKH